MSATDEHRRSAIDHFTSQALVVPRSQRGEWLLHLECDLVAAGKDGFWVAAAVAGRLIAMERHCGGGGG